MHDQVVDDLAAGRYEKALTEAQMVIDRNMANGEGHLLAMTVLQKMGRSEEAKKQEAILNAIGKSIMESGDGASAEKAWFTVAPSETVFFMTEALGAQIEGQELVYVNGHAYDKLTVLDRQGKRRVVWFNTDTNELLKKRATPNEGPRRDFAAHGHFNFADRRRSSKGRRGEPTTSVSHPCRPIPSPAP